MGGSNVRGVVKAFDAHAGLGEIEDQDGALWPFHCISIADGTRTIEPGTAVTFEIRFHVAREEAFDIRPVSG